jgi:hypothetical protein
MIAVGPKVTFNLYCTLCGELSLDEDLDEGVTDHRQCLKNANPVIRKILNRISDLEGEVRYLIQDVEDLERKAEGQ